MWRNQKVANLPLKKNFEKQDVYLTSNNICDSLVQWSTIVYSKSLNNTTISHNPMYNSCHVCFWIKRMLLIKVFNISGIIQIQLIQSVVVREEWHCTLLHLTLLLHVKFLWKVVKKKCVTNLILFHDNKIKRICDLQ